MNKASVLVLWSKQNKVDYKKLISLMYKYSKTDSLIKKHNDNFINAYLKSDKD